MTIERIAVVIAAVAASYLLGSLSFAIIVTRLFIKQDIRTLGSKNAGMMNVIRSVGIIPGLLTGLGDLLKGAAALYMSYWLFSLVELSKYQRRMPRGAVRAHRPPIPVYFGFRGGKGVMTTAGILIMLNPLLLAADFGLYVVSLLIFRIASVASLTVAAALPVLNFLLCFFGEKEWLFSSVFYC